MCNKYTVAAPYHLVLDNHKKYCECRFFVVYGGGNLNYIQIEKKDSHVELNLYSSISNVYARAVNKFNDEL